MIAFPFSVYRKKEGGRREKREGKERENRLNIARKAKGRREKGEGGGEGMNYIKHLLIFKILHTAGIHLLCSIEIPGVHQIHF